MPGVCIQCALEAYVNGEPTSKAMFTESNEEHLKKHADLTPEKRKEWERKAAERLAREGVK